MKFKDFIQMDEVGTSTSCIASFKRIAIPNVRRIFPPELNWIDPEEKKGKKNPYRVPQVDENFAAAANGALRGFGVNMPSYTSQMQQPQQGQPAGAGVDLEGNSAMMKQLSQFMDQEGKKLGVDPKQRQLSTIYKNIAAQLSRVSDQFKQADNMTDNGVESAASNAISSIGNKITNVMNQGGALSRNATT
mgnify:CR=1 FL=1